MLIVLLLQITPGAYTFIQIEDKDDLKQKINGGLKTLYDEAEKGNKTAEGIVNLIEEEVSLV